MSVTFRIDSDTVVTQSIFINYHVGKASFDKASYTLGEEARIIVEDRDMNRNPDTIDTVSARIWSTSDRGGLLMTLRDTGASTGIFEEIITFTIDDASAGNRLKVSVGDTLVLKYTDSTLPAPAPLAADGIETVEVREIFANSIFGSEQGKISTSEPTLLTSSGEDAVEILAGELLVIQSEIKNDGSNKQSFVYVVQVKNADGATVSLSWLTSELMSNDSFMVGQSWVPLVPGDYVIETFVWDEPQNPSILSIERSATVRVS